MRFSAKKPLPRQAENSIFFNQFDENVSKSLFLAQKSAKMYLKTEP